MTMPDVEPWRAQSEWSDPGADAPRVRELAAEPAEVVRVVSALLVHPDMAPIWQIEMPPSAACDRMVRSVRDMLTRIAARGPAALAAPRPPADRFFGVCSHHALLATSILRAHGVPARVHVGFAGYFTPGHFEDHFVCEYWSDRAWRLLDAELGEQTATTFHVDFPPTDVPRERFLDAHTAWRRIRRGDLDPSTVGLSFLGLTGAWFVAQSVLRDAAALGRVELLPWETWTIGRRFGPREAVPDDCLAAFDRVAAALAGAPDAGTVARTTRDEPWLAMTPTVLSFGTGAPVERAIHERSADQ
jgi:transglutaminase superfamily protein